MTPAEKTSAQSKALQELFTNPVSFLRKNSIAPGNAAGNTAGVAEYAIGVEDGVIQRPGSRLGNFRTHDGLKFKIRKPIELPTGTRFQALYIPVQPSNQPINGFPLATVGTNFMITTQLSGCCVVMIPMGNTWSVAHLQPTGETGAQLRTRLAGQGMKVYGATDYAGGRAALVGVRSGGKWRFYVQTQDASFNVTGAKKLSS